MKGWKRPGRAERMQTLIMARPMTSLLEKEILLATDTIRTGRDRWLRPLYDPDHAVSVDRGRTVAYRAIDKNGAILWLVRNQAESMQYHSMHSDPFAALDEAEAAFARRRPANADWAGVEALTRDLMRFRRRLTVTLADAREAGLSPAAIAGFCNRLGVGRQGRMSGWLAAILTRLEPDLGYVLYAAARRQGGVNGI